MFSTLVLFFSLSVPAHVAPATATLAPCEWTTPTVGGISSQVCDGTVVAQRDAAGNVVRFSDWR